MEDAGKKLLIIAEVVILIAVLVLGVIAGVSKIAFKGENILKSEEKKSNSDANTVADAYAEGRITFDDDVEEAIAAMSTEEKVAQMFLVTPEVFTGNEEVMVAGEGTKAAVDETPVAGVVLGKNNLLDKETTGENVTKLKGFGSERSGFPLFAVVDQSAEGNEGVSSLEYMTEYGLNALKVVPVAGVQTAEEYQGAVSESAKVYLEVGIFTMIPFVPDQVANGEGATEDTIIAYRTGFAKGILGSEGVLVSTGNCAMVTGKDDTPVCFSVNATKMLRNEMGFTGVLVSGDLSSLDGVSGADAAVSAVRAGMNLIYFSGDYREGYEAVIQAVGDGKIDQTLIDNAVGRILTAKKNVGGVATLEEPDEEESNQGAAATNQSNRNAGNRANNTNAAASVAPEQPAASEAPTQPEQPAAPEEPAPEQPAVPETSAQPEQPAAPVEGQ